MTLRSRQIKKRVGTVRAGDSEPQNGLHGIRNDDAVFLGWQRMKSGEIFALYNVIAKGHPSFGSTVTDKGLRELNLQVPDAPLPDGPVKKF